MLCGSIVTILADSNDVTLVYRGNGARINKNPIPGYIPRLLFNDTRPEKFVFKNKKAHQMRQGGGRLKRAGAFVVLFRADGRMRN
jgi:hypothetical protein